MIIEVTEFSNVFIFVAFFFTVTFLFVLLFFACLWEGKVKLSGGIFLVFLFSNHCKLLENSVLENI